MKKIFVFALWGSNEDYWFGARRNIELAAELFPEWICRFYIDSNCDRHLIDSISGKNTEKIIVDPEEYTSRNLSTRFDHSGLFWRFIPLSDPDIEIVVSRDVDSRLSKREKAAIEEWLSSSKDFHIMRDHPHHGVPILAGLWGARNGILKNIDILLSYWKTYSNKGRYHADDQDFLGQIIYPIVRTNSFEHSEFGIRFANEIHSFPIERKDFEFAGDVFDKEDKRHPEYWTLIKK